MEEARRSENSEGGQNFKPTYFLHNTESEKKILRHLLAQVTWHMCHKMIFSSLPGGQLLPLTTTTYIQIRVQCAPCI